MQSQYGLQVLPPDEATPFFEDYVLKWAFPTIALICRSSRRPVCSKRTELVTMCMLVSGSTERELGLVRDKTPVCSIN